MRETGILMPVSSLPSGTGIGELGPNAYRWLRALAENGVGIWQILPLNPLGYGNSPYQPYSSCAGDELYLSLEMLNEQGLLKELPPPGRELEKRVDYDGVRTSKEPYLRSAYREFLDRHGEEREEYLEFAGQDWVYLYGVFRAMKADNGGVCWNEWPLEQREWPKERGPLDAVLEREARYHVFLQYLFFGQWMKLKQAANRAGIRIMGDVPFYVGVDSVDVWGGRENFLLDAEGRPTFIAGVPPDYFSATGQRWGNPIYDWEHLKKQGYRFWTERIGYSQRMFDIIRIDHFRAFDTYWKIPASCPTAMEGAWIEAPGYEVIQTLLDAIPGLHLVAEDLGDLRPQVGELKEHFGLKGMKIVQFTLQIRGKYARDVFRDQENLIAYTGTHDNDTILEWYKGLPTAGRRKVRRFLKRRGLTGGPVWKRLLAYTLSGPAEFAILPIWDLMGLDRKAHFNTPGTVGSPNWEWRLTDMEQAERALGGCRGMLCRED